MKAIVFHILDNLFFDMLHYFEFIWQKFKHLLIILIYYIQIYLNHKF